MKIKIRYKYWKVILGIVCFGLFAAFLYFATGSYKDDKESAVDPDANPDSWLRGLYFFFYFVTLLYVALNFYYNLVNSNKKILSFLKLTGIIILVVFSYHIFLYYNFPGYFFKKYKNLSGMLSAVSGYLIPLLIFSYLFAYLTVLREALKQKRILEAQKLILEAQISQANFNFLKAQINPHFLHNTLNFLYAKSLPYSAELSEGILTLSDIMRYALSQGNQKEGKAPLNDEIEHVQNVIKISQLRFSNQLKVNFEIEGNVEGRMIIPFVLITLVENAFKHGDLKNPDYPIDIKLNVKNNKLYFYCRNQKKTGPKQISTGIGLANIKTRLHLAYGENYKFTVKDEPEFYSTELTIDKL